MKIEIRKADYDPLTELRDYQNTMNQSGQYGATSIFIGTMRDFNENESVQEMYLDYYPGMTEKYLTDICSAVMIDKDVVDILLLHRVGQIKPDDTIVLVSVWSGHRKAAFDYSREIMEQLKSKAPFWKKEKLTDGKTRWVEKNTAAN